MSRRRSPLFAAVLMLALCAACVTSEANESPGIAFSPGGGDRRVVVVRTSEELLDALAGNASPVAAAAAVGVGGGGGGGTASTISGVDIHVAADVLMNLTAVSSTASSGERRVVSCGDDSQRNCFFGAGMISRWGGGGGGGGGGEVNGDGGGGGGDDDGMGTGTGTFTATLLGVADDDKVGTATPTFLRSRRVAIRADTPKRLRVSKGLNFVLANLTLVVSNVQARPVGRRPSTHFYTSTLLHFYTSTHLS